MDARSRFSTSEAAFTQLYPGEKRAKLRRFTPGHHPPENRVMIHLDRRHLLTALGAGLVTAPFLTIPARRAE